MQQVFEIRLEPFSQQLFHSDSDCEHQHLSIWAAKAFLSTNKSHVRFHQNDHLPPFVCWFVIQSWNDEAVYIGVLGRIPLNSRKPRYRITQKGIL